MMITVSWLVVGMETTKMGFHLTLGPVRLPLWSNTFQMGGSQLNMGNVGCFQQSLLQSAELWAFLVDRSPIMYLLMILTVHSPLTSKEFTRSTFFSLITLF